MSNLRLMSNNQWKNDYNNDAWKALGGDCSAVVREKGLVKMLVEKKPDILGCQEVSAKMADEMIRGLQREGYRYSLLWGRDTPIIYRPDKFELIDSDFSLYPDELPGREGIFNNDKTKSWNVGVFRVKQDGSLFIFMTTHLWWKEDDPESRYFQPFSEEAKVYQISLAIKKIDELQKIYNAPAVLVGDLNAHYKTKPIQYALNNGFVHAHDIATGYVNETSGCHECNPRGWGEYEPDSTFDSSIDHILIRSENKLTVERFDRYSPDYYLTLSDHAPVFVDINLKK